VPKIASRKPRKIAVKPNPMGSMEPSRRMVDLGPSTHAPTFADHLLMRLRHLKLHLPVGPFPLLRQRKDESALTATEQGHFPCKFSTLNVTGALGQMVQIYGQIHNRHGTLRFLPWHRIFLFLFEIELASIHPDATLSYWGSTQAAEQAFPAWLVGVLPTVSTPNGSTISPELHDRRRIHLHRRAENRRHL